MTDVENAILKTPAPSNNNLREAMARADREIKEAERSQKAQPTEQEIAERTAAEVQRRAALPSSRIIDIGDDLRHKLDEYRAELSRLESDRDVRTAAVTDMKDARDAKNQASIAFHESEIERIRSAMERDAVMAAGATERIEANSATEIEALKRIVSATESMIAGLSKDVSKKGGAK